MNEHVNLLTINHPFLNTTEFTLILFYCHHNNYNNNGSSTALKTEVCVCVCVKRTIKSNTKVGSSGEAKFCRNCSNKNTTFCLSIWTITPLASKKKLDMKEKDINIKQDPNLAISAALKKLLLQHQILFSFDVKYFCKSRFCDKVISFPIHSFISNWEGFGLILLERYDEGRLLWSLWDIGNDNNHL